MSEDYSRGSEWRRWDLQVQTILDDGYVELKNYAENLKVHDADKWKSFIDAVGSEKDALKFDSKEYFYNSSDDEKTRAKNYAKVFVSFLECFHKDEVCIAITDHNYDHSCLLDELLKASQKSSSVSIIAGVEINVQGVHILAVFGKLIYGQNCFSKGIKTFLTKIEVNNKLTDSVLTVSNKSYTEVLNLIKDSSGITIYPHCNSDNGLFQDRGRTDRTHLANQFNYQEFNILQGRDKTGGDKLLQYIASRSNELKSKCSYTTATDARSLKDILKPDSGGNYTWIKADPTFDGLRQITFEHLRVAVQANPPEDKPGYQVIDKIEISNDLILNSEILLNPNMNSIIGGRSTGKSLLLTAIAQSLKTEEPISFKKNSEYESFIKIISSSIKVFWKDGEINNGREIEFFEQGYMHELATNDLKLNELVENILKMKGKESFLESYDAKKDELKKSLSNYVIELFEVISDITKRSNSLSEKGDKKGVEEEIFKLEAKLIQFDSLQLSESERQNYEQHKQQIEDSTRLRDQFSKDIVQIEKLKDFSLVKEDLENYFSVVSDNERIEITRFYEELKSRADKEWIGRLDQSIEQLRKKIGDEETKIKQSEENSDYIKASLAYKDSSQLNEIQDRIKGEKSKLNEIEVLTSKISELQRTKEDLNEKILKLHNEYFSITEAILPQLSNSEDGLEIKAFKQFDIDRYQGILEGTLNLNSSLSRRTSEFEYQDNEQYSTEISQLLARLVSNELTLKVSYTSQLLATAIITECFYRLNYDLVYEGDKFKQMSDGKKSFVVLKLLLDFSDKKCPILIDQPEDNLDNRSIYLDLVRYLKKKKIQRQIIVATHNPNIVVGSDSELVIVANQHGVNSKNRDDKKFAYKYGSLENSSPIDKGNSIVLESQGVREHVCVILEGGDTAFKLREKKYGIEILP